MFTRVLYRQFPLLYSLATMSERQADNNHANFCPFFVTGRLIGFSLGVKRGRGCSGRAGAGAIFLGRCTIIGALPPISPCFKKTLSFPNFSRVFSVSCKSFSSFVVIPLQGCKVIPCPAAVCILWLVIPLNLCHFNQFQHLRSAQREKVLID